MCVSCKNSQSHIKMQIDNTSFRSHHLNRKYVFSPFYNFKLLEKRFRWISDQRPTRDIPRDMNHSANRPTVDVAQRNCTSSHLSPHDKLKAWSLSPSKAKWISFYMTINPQWLVHTALDPVFFFFFPTQNIMNLYNVLRTDGSWHLDI